MFPLLELPLEIRMMIYRSLRTTRSLRLNHPDDTKAIGYASYGFYPQILITNHQISHEAKQVFYGENYWTLYAGQDFNIRSIAFKLPPLSSALPYMRKVFIRFRMFDWLYARKLSTRSEPSLDQFPANFKEICTVLQGAPSLQSLQMAWTESSIKWTSDYPWCDDEWMVSSGPRVDKLSWLLWDFMKPLKALPPTIKIKKGDIKALFGCNARSVAMETAFGNCVEMIIAHHAAPSAGSAKAGR